MLFPTLKDQNIIFLDFDGVLNHTGCKSEDMFLEESIRILNEIHDEFDTKIVLSTSWKDAYVFTDLVRLLQEKGIHAPVIDKTPSYVGPITNKSYKITDITETEFNRMTNPMAGRNREIITYIRIHDINHYVILDDCEMTNPELIPHQVLTTYFDPVNGGLRKKHKALIQNILRNEVTL